MAGRRLPGAPLEQPNPSGGGVRGEGRGGGPEKETPSLGGLLGFKIFVEASWRLLAALGVVLVALGSAWCSLGLSWSFLGRSWASRGALFGTLGALFGAVLGHLGAVVGRFGNQKR